MAYNKKTWVTGETIEASALNNMEDGIEAGQNDDLEKEVEQNTEDIATNKANIEQNASDIATNKANIEQNASDIATNKTNISQNASDIATNKTNISQNSSDIEEINSALAELPEIQTGSVAVSVSGAGATESVNVTFDSAFSHTPRVCVSARSSYPSQVYASVATDGATTTGFTLYYGRSSGSGNFNVTWIAIAT